MLLALLVSCASAPEPGSDPSAGTATAAADSAEASDSTSSESLVCVRNATVTVSVKNQSSMDVQVRFGDYKPARVANGFTRTTYQVARYHLQRSIRLEVLRGGTQVGGPAVIPTEPVFCNSATLLIGSQPRYSFFYGDELYEPIRGGEEEEQEPETEEEPESEAPQTPADSAASDALPTTPA
jgi:hypothetical protein